MRADRLVAILLLLQRRGQVTAAEVADELEISARTARRDLEALSTAGVPVYSLPGRGGGWRLLGEGRTDLSGLTAPEARALFLVAGTSTEVTSELKAALRKLVRALPEPVRDQAEAIGRSVIVDPAGWDRRPQAGLPPMLDELQAAVSLGEQVILGYRNRRGEESTRLVHPLGLAQKARVWYLVAGTADGLRTFRVSRVTAVERTGEPVIRPADFNLEEAWREVVDRVDELRSPAQITALVDPAHVDILRWLFGHQATTEGKAPDGRIRVSIRGQDASILAVQIAGFGRRVEVIDPPEVRDELGALGIELQSLYRTPDDDEPSRPRTRPPARARG